MAPAQSRSPILTAESPLLASLGAGSTSAYSSLQELASGWGEPRGDHGRDPDSFTRSICILGEQEQRMDLSHPVHADNCFLDPDTGECWREPPAYTYRDYRWVVSFSGVGTQRHKGCLAAGLGAGWGPHCLLLPFFISQWTPLPQ